MHILHTQQEFSRKDESFKEEKFLKREEFLKEEDSFNSHIRIREIYVYAYARGICAARILPGG
jgi:hypothetical protein